MSRLAEWWKRQVCISIGHKPADDQFESTWTTCERCGAPFDAAKQTAQKIEDQAFRM